MHVLCDIAMIKIHFRTLLIIFGLTYELSAPQCQFLFSAVFLFQVSPILKVLQKFGKNPIKNQRSGSFRNHRGGGAEGTHQGPRRPPGAPQGGATPGGLLDPWWPPLAAPFAYLFPETQKPRDGNLFRDLSSVSPPPRFQDREHQRTSSQHPAGGRNPLRELLHHHGLFPDVP